VCDENKNLSLCVVYESSCLSIFLSCFLFLLRISRKLLTNFKGNFDRSIYDWFSFIYVTNGSISWIMGEQMLFLRRKKSRIWRIAFQTWLNHWRCILNKISFTDTLLLAHLTVRDMCAFDIFWCPLSICCV
jgi:hypothetical protein